jgi:hypothetical protein
MHLVRPETATVRFAVVGLGNFAQTAILPAFANATDKAKLAALVTGDKEKARKLSRKYRAPAFAYSKYDQLLSSDPNFAREFCVGAGHERGHFFVAHTHKLKSVAGSVECTHQTVNPVPRISVNPLHSPCC